MLARILYSAPVSGRTAFLFPPHKETAIAFFVIDCTALTPNKALFTDLASTVIRASRGRIFVQSTARVFSKSSSKVRHANLAASTYILFAVLRNTFARATSSKPPSKKIFPFSAGEGANPSSESSRLSTASTPLAAVAHSLISPSKILMPLFYHKADGKRIF